MGGPQLSDTQGSIFTLHPCRLHLCGKAWEAVMFSAAVSVSCSRHSLSTLHSGPAELSCFLQVEFGLPDLESRTQIFQIHTRTMNCERDIRFELMSRLCPNSTGADIRSVCTEAGMFAIRARRKTVTEKDFLDAVNKVGSKGSPAACVPRRSSLRLHCKPGPCLALELRSGCFKEPCYGCTSA